MTSSSHKAWQEATGTRLDPSGRQGRHRAWEGRAKVKAGDSNHSEAAVLQLSHATTRTTRGAISEGDHATLQVVLQRKGGKKQTVERIDNQWREK